MSETIFTFAKLSLTTFATPIGRRIQITCGDGFAQADPEEAAEIARALMKWAYMSESDKGELFFQDERKAFELSTRCPRCDLPIELIRLSKLVW